MLIDLPSPKIPKLGQALKEILRGLDVQVRARCCLGTSARIASESLPVFARNTHGLCSGRTALRSYLRSSSTNACL